MSNLIQTAEKEIMRNEILKMCQEATPQGASVQVLRAGLKKMGMDCQDKDVELQVTYLADKQLVTVTQIGNERLGIKRTVVSITASGMDLLDGNMDSVGITNS